MHFDVFNGDADGICALQQLRLAQPRETLAVTGLKREIALLQRVAAQPGDSVTVLDISLDRNRAPLLALLAASVAVEYFDHHFAGELPQHPTLRLHLDAAPHVCTSMIVDRFLGGAHRAWAAVGAFGDNLPRQGEALARAAGCTGAALPLLRELGEAINYNAYGDSADDVLVRPAALALLVRPHRQPLAFLAAEPAARALVQCQREDLALAGTQPPLAEFAGGSVVLLPDVRWARRVQGVFANALSQRAPQRAHAVLREHAGGGFMVNVRVPQRATGRRAAVPGLCRRGRAGGGRGHRLPAAGTIAGLPGGLRAGLRDRLISTRGDDGCGSRSWVRGAWAATSAHGWCRVGRTCSSLRVAPTCRRCGATGCGSRAPSHCT